MPDDQMAQAEATASEAIQDQAAAEEPNGSEAAPNAGDEAGKGKGDPWAAMHQEREKRQSLEAQLNDPQFIYAKARELGLTEEQAEEAAQPQAPAPGSYQAYRYYSELEKSQEKYPQLAADKEDQIAVTALMQGLGLSPMQAADRYYGKLRKAAEAAKEERQAQQDEAAEAKRQAATPSSTAPGSTAESAEYEDLVRRSKDYRNPREAERAQQELVRWRLRHRS